MIKIILDGKITVTEADQKTRDAIMTGLRLQNPSYHQAIRANPRARFALSEWIKYYETRRSGELLAPRGARKRLEDYARKTGQELIVEDRTTSVPTTAAYPSIRLRDYQCGVTEIVSEHHQGVLRLDTGFGKTIIGLDLITKLKQKTLIIVPKLDLLTNWQREAKQHLGVDLGLIQGSTTNVTDITVATIQSLHRRLEDGSLKGDEFGCLIVDECHGFVSEIARRSIAAFSAKYRYGLTATARRTDGQGDAIGFIFGEVLVDRKMARATPEVELVRSTTHIWVQEYAEMIDEQIASVERNQLILDIIEAERKQGRRILVLTKRVAHYETLKQKLGDDGVFALASSGKKEERSTLLSALRDGSQPFSVLLGTFPLLATGIDIPSLDTLIVAGDLKSDVLTEQSAGRILRLFEGKQSPKVIDIWDTNNFILKRQGVERQGFYRAQNWKVTYGKNELAKSA